MSDGGLAGTGYASGSRSSTPEDMMTLRRSTLVAALVAALVLLSAAARMVEAQSGRTHLGPRLSYHLDLEKIGIGAQFSVPLTGNLEFYPSIDYFPVSNATFWNLNADLKYRIATESINWLYLGAGLNLAHRSAGGSDNTRAGVNGFVGIESRRGPVHPFGELRLTVNNGTSGQIAAGLNFTLR
jgi:hypothetical protein